MDGIEVLIIPIVAGIIATTIIEVMKAPIRKYLRKRGKLKKVSEGRSHAKKKRPQPKEVSEVIEVMAGSFTPEVLHLKEGSRVSGLAEEINNRQFSMYVLDKEGYSAYRNNLPFASLLREENMVAIPFEFHIPMSGKWYFVFDAYRKQYPREILFDCTIHP